MAQISDSQYLVANSIEIEKLSLIYFYTFLKKFFLLNNLSKINFIIFPSLVLFILFIRIIRAEE